jgi:ribosomal-protein-alanine N-acetyltransferase
VDVPSIVTARLELVSMSPEFMRASLDGDLVLAARLLGAALPSDWPVAAAGTLRRRLHQLAHDPCEQPWLLRAMLSRSTPRTLVGRIGFHAPPDARGAVEIGYAVEPEYRRHGYATEAVEAMLAWARREHGIRRFVASVSPTNAPSLAIVKKFGFVQTGSQWDDEDGEELVFELQL